MASHLSHALLALLDRRKATATSLAIEIGVHQTTVSRACSGERVAAESLRSLCTRQHDPRDGLDLLLAHLRDEVERAGRHQGEISIAADDREPDSDIRLLEEQAREDDELRAILHDLAQLVRSMRRKLTYQQTSGLLAVAEDDVQTLAAAAGAAATRQGKAAALSPGGQTPRAPRGAQRKKRAARKV